MKRIFVYGSLREGMYNYDKYLKGHVVSNTQAYVKGTLHQLHDVTYPALIEGTSFILGEIIEIDHDGIEDDLDELEGYQGAGNDHNEYDKVMMNIYDQEQQLLEQLPVYVYNTRTQKQRIRLGKQIIGNDYVTFMKEKAQMSTS